MLDKNASDKTVLSEQFNAVLMSFIHDIKNSLLISLSSLETLYYSLEAFDTELKENVSLIQYELQRMYWSSPTGHFF
ncbi:MAG: hypothetical protein KZQ70_01870 [gamma proteobacterium symbiont of Lucinoma myriamae]|nr:hypothetical protein [gamma proteobacterium symbiont of Lucinoma myriamae]MCU7818013.1 hypothetical protein [gamma proteobacterium symbiont of Lucinoma myriamae]MCU7831305.1 hypothetical protein [gamma proteobacterium symbiont of Lucinoma myriamae]